jgi:hypothetical protein
MARYIDADWIYEKVENRYRLSSGIEHRCERDLLDLICSAPTADVAPKSEVERLEQENEALKDSNEHLAVLLAESTSEVAIEIIQDIAKACAPHDHHLNSLDFEIGYITAMNQVIAQLEEIKKKYTEEGGLYAMC